MSKEEEVYLPVANNSRLVPARLLPPLFAGESEENDLQCNQDFAVFGRAKQASLALDVFPTSIPPWVLRGLAIRTSRLSKSISLLCAGAVSSNSLSYGGVVWRYTYGTSNAAWRVGGPLCLYIYI